MDPMLTADEIAPAVGSELERFPHLTFAVLFGSAASGRLRPDSDVDVAFYGASAGRLEIEQEREIDRETEIQIALERATQRNVELLVLNRAPATVCAAALTSGRVVLMRDGALYSRYFLAVTSVAIDFLQTEREYRAIRDRSRSLSPVDRSRLERIVDFIDTELRDRERFRGVTQHRYRSDRDLRRNLDRWVEILINAAIEFGKVVLVVRSASDSLHVRTDTRGVGSVAGLRRAVRAPAAAGSATQSDGARVPRPAVRKDHAIRG